MSEERQRRRNERIMLANRDLSLVAAMLQTGNVLSAARLVNEVLTELRDIARLDAQEERG